MATEPESPVKDKNYNLFAMLQESLQRVWQLDTYIQDAERRGDSELAAWFREMQDHSRNAGEKGKQLLRQRLQQEGG